MPLVTSSRVLPGTGEVIFPVAETDGEPAPRAGVGSATESDTDGSGRPGGPGSGGGNSPPFDIETVVLGTGASALEIEEAAGRATFRVRTLRAGTNVALTVNSAGEIVIAAPALSFPEPPPGTLAVDGFDIRLGDVAAKGDGSWTPGAVAFADNLPISEAMDRLNEVLSLLVPAPPPDLGTRPLAVVASGLTPLLADGAVPNNTGTTLPASLVAGSPVARVAVASVAIQTFDDVGPGNAGTVALLVNGADVGSRALAGTGDAGAHGGLVLSDQKDFPPSQPGFWRSLDVAALAPVEPGWNRVRLRHTASSPQETNEVFFVRDAMLATPSLSAGSVEQEAAGALSHSSSVPHYGTGASLRVTVSVANLSGETYYGGVDPLTVSGTNGVLAPQNFGYAALGVAAPIPRNRLAPTALAPVVALVNGTGHAAGSVSMVARNPNGPSSAFLPAPVTILLRAGAAGPSRVDEAAVPITSLGSGSGPAVRVGGLPGADTPPGPVAAWVGTAPLPAHEAAVVAGVLSHNTTDYTTGFLPVGPNLSTGRSGPQYATFAVVRSAVSQFRVAVTGAYAGVWVKLPGVSDDAAISPNALGGGWWDARSPYSGAGVPGRAGDGVAGCAAGAPMSGASGTFALTFGAQSSTNAAGNVILVRFRLNAGQSVTALAFSN